MTERDIDQLARAIYETATEGHYVETWSAMPTWRKWRWLNAAHEAARRLGRAPRSRTIKVAR